MIEKIPEPNQISEAFKSLKTKNNIRFNNLVGDLAEYYCEQNFGIKLSES